MVNFHLILVFVVILFIIISLYLEILGATFTFLVAVVTLGFFGVLTPHEIISGFANEQIAVIIMLLLLGDIIRRTAVIDNMFEKIFSGSKSDKGFLSRMMLAIAGFSAFLNNTPLVAVMMPYVNNWCKRHEISPSKFLIPLSYAAILGGCATLIGTSTNLIVSGLVVDQTIVEDLEPLNIFDFVWVGVPMIIIGYLYFMFWGFKLLPERKRSNNDTQEINRSFVVETQIRKNSKLVGKNVGESGLRDLKGLYLVEIQRNEKKIFVVTNSLVLAEGDILVFAGNTDKVTDLLERSLGLSIPSVGMLRRKKKTEVVEIVIAHNSSLINKSLKQINFRAKFDAAVIGVHREEGISESKLRDVVVKAGDVLLLYSGDDFISRSRDTRDFYYISKVKSFQRFEPYKVPILVGGLFISIILSALHIIPLFMGLIVLLLASLAMNVTNPKDLPKGIDYDLGLIIVMSLALGTAMIKSGAADLVATFFINIFLPFGRVGLLFGIYLITAFMGAYITNKAAVAIVFPISLSMAVNLELPYMPFILVVAYAAAANFLTPVGYQTNLMVYGPGGYKFKDFFKVGFPLTMIYMVVTVTILGLIYF